MMKKLSVPALSLIPAAFLLWGLSSCGGDTATDKPTDSVGTADSAQQLPAREYAQVPSPGEMFAFMKQAGSGNASADLLNSPDNEKKYETKKAQALNMGIYSSDLLYCCTFSNNLSNRVAQYFGTTMRMSEKLQVTTNLTEKDKERISKNVGNADSLVAISNDLYLSSFDNLDANGRGADLSLMLAGGWVEALYLMSSSVKDFDKDKAAAERIADQKHSLDNLVEYMAKHEDNADVKATLVQLGELKGLFDALASSKQDGGMKSTNGKRVLGGGNKTSITKEQFEAIKAKVTEIRTGFIAVQ
ncbi:MAG: hypothetical protein MUC87_20035 [Bacteroidia bacterium]|nr:hypothetical protein [Bacteroidia bacterium]